MTKDEVQKEAEKFCNEIKQHRQYPGIFYTYDVEAAFIAGFGKAWESAVRVLCEHGADVDQIVDKAREVASAWHKPLK
jgi:ribosomal protein S11